MTMTRLTRTVLTLVGVTLLVACETGGNRPDAELPASTTALVTVAPVIQQSLTEWDTFTGRLEAPERVELRARVSGHLQEVTFEEGDMVEEGDLLFRIDDRPFDAEVKRLEAELASAESRRELADSQLQRARTLAQEHAIARQALDEREAAFQQAVASVQSIGASLDNARLQLEFTRVRAPISGRVSNARITQGNYIRAGDSLLTTIVSTSEIYAYFDADEQSYLKYARMAQSGTRPSSRDTHNPVYMSLAGESEFAHRGHIDFIDNQVDPRTGTIRGRAVFDNTDGLLIPGLFARIRLVGSGTYNGILIDDRAIATDLDRKYVLVIDDENIARYREVTLGEKVAGLRIIKTGLQGGDLVVVNGLQRVRPGDAVAPEKVAMASPSQTRTLAAMQHRVTLVSAG